MCGWMDGLLDVGVDRYLEGWMDPQLDRCVGGWMSGGGMSGREMGRCGYGAWAEGPKGIPTGIPDV